jgi:hypothetical protein
MPNPYRKVGLSEVIVTVLALGAPHAALADDDAVAKAAVLSREGEKLLKDGKTGEACDKYQQSQALDPRGETLLDEALCREKEGKLGTAYNLFIAAEKAANDEKRNDRALTAKQHQNSLFAKLPRLSVNVPKESVTDGLEISAGGQVIPQSEWGKPYPVDGGSLKVSASAPARETWETTVDSKPGIKQSVTVPVLKPGSGPAPNPNLNPNPNPNPNPNNPNPNPNPNPNNPNPNPPPKGEGHKAHRIVVDAQVLAGMHVSVISKAPQSLINGTQYNYIGADTEVFQAACGTEDVVPGAGNCKAHFKPQAALLAGAELFIGYAITENVQFGGRVMGGFHYPIGFEILGGPSASFKVSGPFWLGITGLVGTSQTTATVDGARGSVPESFQTFNPNGDVVIAPDKLAGGLAGSATDKTKPLQVAPDFGVVEVGGSVEVSIVLKDNKSGTTGSLMLSGWPYAVWSPGGVAFGLPIGLGYRFY